MSDLPNCTCGHHSREHTLRNGCSGLVPHGNSWRPCRCTASREPLYQGVTQRDIIEFLTITYGTDKPEYVDLDCLATEVLSWTGQE